MPRITIGSGLFAGQAEVFVEDLEATFTLKPLTTAVMAALKKKGVDFTKVDGVEKVDRASKGFFREVVLGWEDLRDSNGAEVPFTEENRDTLATVPEVVDAIFRAAKAAAATVEEAEEGN